MREMFGGDSGKTTVLPASTQVGQRHTFRIWPKVPDPAEVIEWADETGTRFTLCVLPDGIWVDSAKLELAWPAVSVAPGQERLLEVEWLARSVKIFLDGRLVAIRPHGFGGRQAMVSMPLPVVAASAEWPSRELGAPYDGAMDHVSPTEGPQGWALNRDAIGRPLRIDVVCQGRLLAHGHTLLPRPDLDAALGAVTRCGFAIGWHRFDVEAVRDVANSDPAAPVEFRIAQTGEALRVVTEPMTAADLVQRPIERGEGQPLVEDYATLAGSGLLDATWYQTQTGCAGDPLLHYLTEGEAAGQAPNFYFDPVLAANALQLEGTRGVLALYARHPRRVPRPGLHFHQRWYVMTYAVAEGLTPIADHLLQLRYRAPNPYFDPATYCAQGPDEAGAADPYRHYLDRPDQGEVRVSPNFNPAVYLEATPDDAARQQPFLHFLSQFDLTGMRVSAPAVRAQAAVAEEEGVSVVVPNRNYAQYLYQRMESIFRQNWPVLEVIVIDDASEDGSTDVIQSVARHHRRDVDLVLQARPGGNVFRQWFRAAQRARGRYLWIAEADDSSDPRFLATLMQGMLKDEGVLFAFCDSRALGADGRILQDDHQNYYGSLGPSPLAEDRVFEADTFLRQVLTPRNLVLNASAVVWRRTALLETFGRLGDSAFELTCAGDWRIYVQACAQPGRVHYSALPLNDHRRHPASVSRMLDPVPHLAEIQAVHAAILRQTGPREEVVAGMHRHIEDLKRAWGIASLQPAVADPG